MSQKVKCLCCEKELEFTEHDLVYDGGFIEIQFHYGSRHDQCKGFTRSDPPPNSNKIEKLIHCDVIEAYICDDCFESKQDLMKGFVVERKSNKKRIV